MKQELTRDFIMANRGCYSKGQVDRLFPISVTLADLLLINFPLKDKFWFVCKKIATKEENQQIAIAMAEIVLPFFEAKYPNDLQPREAIKAARLYITGHISLEELLQKRAAAYAAAMAADAAAAAAMAAFHAAKAAAYTSSDYSKQLLDFLIEFCKNSNQ